MAPVLARRDVDNFPVRYSAETQIIVCPSLFSSNYLVLTFAIQIIQWAVESRKWRIWNISEVWQGKIENHAHDQCWLSNVEICMYSSTKHPTPLPLLQRFIFIEIWTATQPCELRQPWWWFDHQIRLNKVFDITEHSNKGATGVIKSEERAESTNRSDLFCRRERKKR